jgi:hypothetical protein
MQNALPASYPRSAGKPHAQSRIAPTFFSTIQSTVRVLEKHPVAVLACACVLFASAGFIGSLLYGALVGEVVLRTGSHSGSIQRIYTLQMLVQSILGAFTLTLGRGAISWIALHTTENLSDVALLRAALNEARRRWRTLLAATLFYGLVISLGILGVTLFLREIRMDVSNARWLRGDLDSVLNWTFIRGIATLFPDAGSPFSELIAAAKYNLARMSTVGYFGFDVYSQYASGDVPRSLLILGGLSVMFLLVSEALLCMRTAVIMSAANTGRLQMDWLIRTVRLGAMHFRRVAPWRWMLQLGVATLVTCVLVLLPALHQVTIMQEVRESLSTGYWPYHIALAFYGMAGAFVSGLLIAFTAAFEARMYAVLTAE